MWPRATNPENWLPQSQFIKVISTVRVRRTGGSEIHERVAQLFVVVHNRIWQNQQGKIGFCLLGQISVQNFVLKAICAFFKSPYHVYNGCIILMDK